MKTSFVIYIWAVGLYAVLTIPAIFIPLLYLISIFYVLLYGWFAWGLFSMIYLLTDVLRMNYPSKIVVLVTGVVISVAFAYQMLEILDVENDVWHSEFIWFPLAAVIAGWTSLCLARKQVMGDRPGYTEQSAAYTGETTQLKNSSEI